MIILLVYFGFIILCGLLFGKRQNPYISLHKKKWKNEIEYREYLEWLNRKGGDVPINKAKFDEDKKVENEIKRYL